MKIENVIVAKALWFVDPRDLNPRGRNIYKAIVPKLEEQFGFTRPTEFDEEKGIIFSNGEFSPSGSTDDAAGVTLSIYNNGVMAACCTSTSDAEKFLDILAALLSGEGIISYRPDMVTKRVYASEVFARSERHLVVSQLGPVYALLSDLLYGGKSQFSCVGLTLDVDPQIPSALRQPAFKFERRVNAPIEENRWYSYAPTSSDRHQLILNAIEDALAV